MKRHLK
jgi:hypothetical protein